MTSRGPFQPKTLYDSMTSVVYSKAWICHLTFTDKFNDDEVNV